MTNYFLHSPAANDDAEAAAQVAALVDVAPAPIAAASEKSTFVPAVRVPPTQGAEPAQHIERIKHSLPTFALGAAAGIGLSLVFFHVLAPARGSAGDQMARIEVDASLPAVAAPRFTMKDIPMDPVPVVTVTPLSIIERAADQVTEHHSPVTAPRVAAVEPRATPPQSGRPSAPPAFNAGTVAYEAPETPVATSAPAPVAHPEAMRPQSSFNVISVPSASLALIAAQVQGQTLVSPYKVGQALPDGRVITAMDPASGTVSTSSGDLRTVAAN